MNNIYVIWEGRLHIKYESGKNKRKNLNIFFERHEMYVNNVILSHVNMRH